jgi:hypothetical protein
VPILPFILVSYLLEQALVTEHRQSRTGGELPGKDRAKQWPVRKGGNCIIMIVLLIIKEKAERSDGQCVGARFIAPAGCGGADFRHQYQPQAGASIEGSNKVELGAALDSVAK